MRCVLVEVVKSTRNVTVNKMEFFELKKEFLVIQNKLNDILSKDKVNNLEQELQTIEEKTNESGFWDNPKTASLYLKNKNKIENLINDKNTLKNSMQDFATMLDWFEEDMVTLEELNELFSSINNKYSNFELETLLNGEFDDKNVLVEFNPGAGGTESQDWAEMLYNMYVKYADKNNLKCNILAFQVGDGAGIKNAMIEIKGNNLYGKLKKETGIHRLVRLSPFDSQNKRHTSFAAVKVTPIIEDEVKVEINQNDIKIDTFRSSGAGGQGVNTTDSAVRITHIPSKIVVTCQNERSQIQNRETAMKILKIKLFALEQEKRDKKKNEINSNSAEISFGSQKRSYVLHPYKLVKDHESGHESSQPDKVLNGDLEQFLYKNLINENVI